MKRVGTGSKRVVVDSFNDRSLDEKSLRHQRNGKTYYRPSIGGICVADVFVQ
jgi:hypothetical protein